MRAPHTLSLIHIFSISVEKKDAATEEKLEGVIFGLYAKEDILSQQGEILVEKDMLRSRAGFGESITYGMYLFCFL